MSERTAELTSHGVLILIDEVFGHIFGHELVCGLRHPSVHKGCKIKKRGAIKRQLVVEKLVRRLRVSSLRASQLLSSSLLLFLDGHAFDGILYFGNGYVP